MPRKAGPRHAGGSSSSGLPRDADGRQIPEAPRVADGPRSQTRRVRKQRPLIDHVPALGAEPRLRTEDVDDLHDETELVPAPEDHPRLIPRPDVKKPAAHRVREHELTHVPFEPWCDTCVAARGLAKPHRQQGNIPQVSTGHVNPVHFD